MTATTALVARRNPLELVLAGPIGSFDAYVDAVSRIPVLSREDEHALAARLRNDDDLDAARAAGAVAPALRRAHRARLCRAMACRWATSSRKATSA